MRSEDRPVETRVERYVAARDIEQPNRTLMTRAMQADVWLGGMNETDGDNVYATLEIKPAWGQIAAIRLSPNELRDLGAMIAERLGNDEDDIGPIELNVPEGRSVRITYV